MIKDDGEGKEERSSEKYRTCKRLFSEEKDTVKQEIV